MRVGLGFPTRNSQESGNQPKQTGGQVIMAGFFIAGVRQNYKASCTCMPEMEHRTGIPTTNWQWLTLCSQLGMTALEAEELAARSINRKGIAPRTVYVKAIRPSFYRDVSLGGGSWKVAAVAIDLVDGYDFEAMSTDAEGYVRDPHREPIMRMSCYTITYYDNIHVGFDSLVRNNGGMGFGRFKNYDQAVNVARAIATAEIFS
jgi:hypothetical protein